MISDSPLNRRRFAAASAGVLTAAIMRGRSPNEKVVLALVGAGGRGPEVAWNTAQVENVEFKYICDVDDTRGHDITKRLEEKQGNRLKRVIDMREVFDDKDVNGVIVGTPDHWHSVATVWACQAGKDVYVEKNISMTIWEGRKMVEAARKYDRIVQCGTENRSGPYAVTAREYLQSGKLGRIVLVKVYNLLGGGPWNPVPDTDPPPGLDWDRWLGPAPWVHYNPGRHHGWYHFWDYKGGALVDDGIHQLDLARMVLGDPPHPSTVYCAGGRLAYDDQRETPDLQVITYDYGNFVMTCESGSFTPYVKKFPTEVRYGTTWPNWPLSSCRIEIYGTKQMMYLGRHGCGWQVLEEGGKVVAQDKGYFPDKWHQPNFVECMRTRKRPNADPEMVHPSACLVHMANVAYRTGRRRLEFDGKTETFVNDDRANSFLKPTYRKHYGIPEVV
jgi:predicted dehydrogenase